MYALSKRPLPVFGQASGPDSGLLQAGHQRGLGLPDTSMWYLTLSVPSPGLHGTPLTLCYTLTQRFRKAKPQAWVSELLGAVQEGMPSPPSKHLAPVPYTPHFSHTQQWGSSPTIIYTECWLETWEGQG